MLVESVRQERDDLVAIITKPEQTTSNEESTGRYETVTLSTESIVAPPRDMRPIVSPHLRVDQPQQPGAQQVKWRLLADSFRDKPQPIVTAPTHVAAELANTETEPYTDSIISLPPVEADATDLAYIEQPMAWQIESLEPQANELLPSPRETFLSLLDADVSMGDPQTDEQSLGAGNELSLEGPEQPKIVQKIIARLETVSQDTEVAIKPVLAEIIAIVSVLGNPEDMTTLSPEQHSQYTERLQVVIQQLMTELNFELSEEEAGLLLEYLVARSSSFRTNAQAANLLLDLGTHEQKHRSAFISSALLVEDHLHRLLGTLAIQPQQALMSA